MNLPEYLSDGAWDVARRLFATVFRLLIDTGGQSVGIRFGSSALTFAASTNSASTTIPHGLGRLPIVVLALPFSSPAFGKIPTLNLSSSDATSIVLNGEIGTAHTGSISFSWAVIG